MAALTRTLAAAASLPGRRGTAQSPDVDDQAGGSWSSSRSRPGLAEAGCCPATSSTAARLIASAPGVDFGGLWTHLQASEDPERTAAPARALRRGVEADVRAAGVALPARHVAASGGLIDGHPGLRRRAPRARRSTASCPTSSTARRSTRRGGVRRGPAPGHVAPRPSRCASPTCRPVTGSATARRVGPARPSRIATLPLGYGDGFGRGLSNRAEALVRGRRVPLVGNVAMDAVMADVTDVPGPPVDDRRRVRRSSATQGEERITAGELARPRTTNSLGGRDRDGPPPAPGVPCRRRHRSVCGRSPSGEGDVARIELWNGDICDLEVDAIVNAGQPVAVDVDRRRRRAQARRRRRDRVRGRPPGARPARRGHRDDRPARSPPRPSSTPSRSIATGGPADRSSRRPSAARWPAPARSARRSIAFPALGTGVGGFPLDEAARITVDDRPRRAGRSARPSSTSCFALRGAAAYEAFGAALPIRPASAIVGAGAAS